jgi:hypothetical protein
MAEARSNTKLFGLLAEFETPAAIHHACEQVRDAGYTRWDAHAPFPVHGLDRAMGLTPSKLPFIALVGGLGGAGAAMLLQWYTSTVDYPLVISGKPMFSWPAYVPVTFEFGVLLGALGAVLGMLFLNRLPQLYHPLFHSKKFERVTDDRFFISIEAADPEFDEEKTAQFLKELGATHVEKVDK